MTLGDEVDVEVLLVAVMWVILGDEVDVEVLLVAVMWVTLGDEVEVEVDGVAEVAEVAEVDAVVEVGGRAGMLVFDVGLYSVSKSGAMICKYKSGLSVLSIFFLLLFFLSL